MNLVEIVPSQCRFRRLLRPLQKAHNTTGRQNYVRGTRTQDLAGGSIE
jgi:hypothetical protein